MAIGDITNLITANSSSYVDFVPTGSNTFLILSTASEAQLELLMSDGASNCQVFQKPATTTLMPDQANLKVLTTNSIYTRTYGTGAVAFSMVQVS
jgi:hypothetical protein